MYYLWTDLEAIERDLPEDKLFIFGARVACAHCWVRWAFHSDFNDVWELIAFSYRATVEEKENLLVDDDPFEPNGKRALVKLTELVTGEPHTPEQARKRFNEMNQSISDGFGMLTQGEVEALDRGICLTGAFLKGYVKEMTNIYKSLGRGFNWKDSFVSALTDGGKYGPQIDQPEPDQSDSTDTTPGGGVT